MFEHWLAFKLIGLIPKVIHHEFLPKPKNNTRGGLYVVSKKPPSGFLDVKSHKLIKPTVFFMGKKIGAEIIILNHSDIQFLSPIKVYEKLVAAYPESSRVANLKNWLLEGTLLWRERKKPEIVQYVYNAKKNVIKLSIKKTVVKQSKKTSTLQFLGPSSSGFSAINKLHALLSGNIHGSMGNENYAFMSASTFAYKNNHVFSDLLINKINAQKPQVQFINLYGQTDYHARQLSYGFLTSGGQLFFPTQTYLGASITTNTSMLLNRNELISQPLIVFIPTPSQVSITANNRLVFTGFLQPGYQSINTSNFPDGAYNIIIRIGQTVKQQYFVRTNRLPPRQFLEYHLSVGYLTKTITNTITSNTLLPDVTSTPLGTLGVNKRISRNLALHADLLGSSKEGYITAGTLFFLHRLFVDLCALVGSDGETGAKLSLNYSKRFITSSLTGFALFSHSSSTQASLPLLTTTKYYLNSAIGVTFNRYNDMHLIAQYEQPLNDVESYNYGLSYQHYFFIHPNTRLSFNFSYNRSTVQGDVMLVGLTLNFNKAHFFGSQSFSWAHNNIPIGSDSDRLGHVNWQGTLNHTNQSINGYGTNYTFSHHFSDQHQSMGGSYQYTNSKIHTNLYSNIQLQSGMVNYSYGGEIGTEFIWTPQATAFNGARLNNNAGLLTCVYVPNEYKAGAHFMLLNERYAPIKMLHVNQWEYVPLSAYQMRRFYLRNQSNIDFSIRKNPKTYTFYPGNVVSLNWQVSKKIIVTGQLINNHNEPIVDSMISVHDSDMAYTDQTGYFQLELHDTDKRLRVTQSNGKICYANLPKLSVKKSYLYLEKLRCD